MEAATEVAERVVAKKAKEVAKRDREMLVVVVKGVEGKVFQQAEVAWKANVEEATEVCVDGTMFVLVRLLR